MKSLYMLLILLSVISVDNLISDDYDDEWEDPFSINSLTLFGQYSFFIGDFGAQWKNGISIGTMYDYKLNKDMSVGALLEFQRWSDFRNVNSNTGGGVGQTNQLTPRNFLGNNKLGAVIKGYIPSKEGMDLYFGGILSYNFVNYIYDMPATSGGGAGTPVSGGQYIRTKADDNSLGIDVIGGAKIILIDNLKLDIFARIGWLGLTNNSPIVAGLNAGICYEF